MSEQTDDIKLLKSHVESKSGEAVIEETDGTKQKLVKIKN